MIIIKRVFITPSIDYTTRSRLLATHSISEKVHAIIVSGKPCHRGKYGYNVARFKSMRYQIKFFEEAYDDLKRIKAYQRAEVLDAIETHLRFEPAKTSQSRIKQLRDMKTPQFRLHVGAIRVFYDVNGDTVEIIAVVFKSDAADWLDREGEKL